MRVGDEKIVAAQRRAVGLVFCAGVDDDIVQQLRALRDDELAVLDLATLQQASERPVHAAFVRFVGGKAEEEDLATLGVDLEAAEACFAVLPGRREFEQRVLRRVPFPNGSTVRIQTGEGEFAQMARAFDAGDEGVVALLVDVLKRGVAVVTQRFGVFSGIELAVAVVIRPDDAAKAQRLVRWPDFRGVARCDECAGDGGVVTVFKTEDAHGIAMLRGGDEELLPEPAPHAIDERAAVRTWIIGESGTVERAGDPLFVAVVIEAGEDIAWRLRIGIHAVEEAGAVQAPLWLEVRREGMQAALAHAGHADIAHIQTALRIKTDATDVLEALRADFALLRPPSAFFAETHLVLHLAVLIGKTVNLMLRASIGHEEPFRARIDGDVHRLRDVVEARFELRAFILQHTARDHLWRRIRSHTAHGQIGCEDANGADGLRGIERHKLLRVVVELVEWRGDIRPRAVAASGARLHLQLPEVRLRAVAHEAEPGDGHGFAEIEADKRARRVLGDVFDLVRGAHGLLEAVLRVDGFAAKDLALQRCVCVGGSGPLNDPQRPVFIHEHFARTLQRDVKVERLQRPQRQRSHAFVIREIDAIPRLVDGEAGDAALLLRQIGGALLRTVERFASGPFKEHERHHRAVLALHLTRIGREVLAHRHRLARVHSEAGHLRQRIAIFVDARRPQALLPLRREKHKALRAHRHVRRVELHPRLRLVGKAVAANERVAKTRRHTWQPRNRRDVRRRHDLRSSGGGEKEIEEAHAAEQTKDIQPLLSVLKP